MIAEARGRIAASHSDGIGLRRALAFFGVLSSRSVAAQTAEGIVEIGQVAQFFIDDGIVDNRWAIRYEDGSKEMVTRVLHPPRKHDLNPLLSPELGADRSGPQPGFGAVNVIREGTVGRFRMWYQWSVPIADTRRLLPVGCGLC